MVCRFNLIMINLNHMKPKPIFIYAAIIVVGLVFFLFYADSGNQNPNMTPSPSGTITISPIPTLTPTPANSAKPTVSASPPVSYKTPSCNISGEIVFLDPAKGIYETRSAEFNWQNVDSPARHIFWNYTPDDGSFDFGPRIFASLPLPDGSYIPGVSVVKDKTPSVKSYSVTSYITYGVTDLRGVETIKNMLCTGSIKLTLP